MVGDGRQSGLVKQGVDTDVQSTHDAHDVSTELAAVYVIHVDPIEERYSTGRLLEEAAKYRM